MGKLNEKVAIITGASRGGGLLINIGSDLSYRLKASDLADAVMYVATGSRISSNQPEA